MIQLIIIFQKKIARVLDFDNQIKHPISILQKFQDCTVVEQLLE